MLLNINLIRDPPPPTVLNIAIFFFLLELCVVGIKEHTHTGNYLIIESAITFQSSL